MTFLLFNFFKFLLNSSNKNSGTIISADFPKISFFLYLKILSADLFQKVILSFSSCIITASAVCSAIIASRSFSRIWFSSESPIILKLLAIAENSGILKLGILDPKSPLPIFSIAFIIGFIGRNQPPSAL